MTCLMRSGITEDRQILRRIALDTDDIGEIARRDHADLPFHAHADRARLSRALDRLQLRQAEVLGEDFHFSIVPMAIRHHREAAFASAEQGHAGVVGAPERLHAVGDFAAEMIAQTLVGAHGLAEIGHVGLERERRRDRHALVDDGSQRLVVHARRMVDQVDACLGRIANRTCAATMADDRRAEIMRDIAEELVARRASTPTARPCASGAG